MPDGLILSRSAYDVLRTEAERAEPSECCGVLAGRDNRVTTVYPVPNAAEDRAARYEMGPAEMWAARRRAGVEGLEVLGFYHSHPRTPPVPSSHDVARAYYPEAVYAIVGLVPRFAVRAFRIADGVVDEVEVDVEHRT